MLLNTLHEGELREVSDFSGWKNKIRDDSIDEQCLENDDNSDVIRKRVRMSVSSKSDDERFMVKNADFSKQFSNLYFSRLRSLREHIHDVAKAHFPDVKICDTSLKLVTNQDCIFVGTVYKEMKLKPCVLDDYKDDIAIGNEKLDDSNIKQFTSDDDSLILEDDFGRVTLSSSPEVLSAASLVSGVVIGVRGVFHGTGIFEVKYLLEPGLAPQNNIMQIEGKDLNAAQHSTDPYVVLMSGLSVGNSECNDMAPQLLVDYLCGALGETAETSMLTNVCRIIIAGNSLCERTTSEEDTTSLKRQNKSQRKSTTQSLKDVDMLLEQLCSSIDVHVLPGEHDPATFALPQQPIHPFMLPRASRLSSLHRCSNPCSFDLDSVSFVGSSGQNLDDIMRYSAGLSRLDALEKFVRWRIIAPTCPDTLSCYPFSAHDPFVLHSLPHVIFAGNQPEFGTRLLDNDIGARCRLVLIPSFAKSGTIVLLNLRTLQVEPFTVTSL